MNFQQISDLHLEYQKTHEWKVVKNFIQPSAPYLLLVGDIAPPSCPLLQPFLAYISKKFTHVFLISGNHEYQTKRYDLSWNEWMSHVDQELRTLCASFPNITFLQNEVYHFQNTNLSIFGGTFWSIPDPAETQIPKMISDQRAIPGFTIEKSTELHKQAIQILENTLRQFPERDWIVLSHHMPSLSLIDEEYADSPINTAFATDIQVASHPRIKAWVQGHTHTRLQKPPFYCNPLGYPGENSLQAWKPQTFSPE